MISLSLFNLLISSALFVTCLSPIVLIILLIRDIKKGDLW